MDYNANSVPEIRMAPEHKPINFDKFGKRKEQTLPDFVTMTNEQLWETLCVELFGVEYDQTQYKKNPHYKNTADAHIMKGLMALATLYYRENNVPLDKIIAANTLKVEAMKKHVNKVIL